MDIANEVSRVFPWLIAAFGAVNLVIWAWLVFGSNARKKDLRDYLFNAVGALSRRSDLTHNMSIDERINTFMADIRDAVESSNGKEDARPLLERLMTKDEERIYLKTHRFERWYSIARSSIEIFPLLGIIGTVIAIGAGMSTSGTNDAEKVARVVQNFGHSVWSTAFGLGAAIIFMGVNAWFEPEFERLLGYADKIGDLIAHAKAKLAFAASAGPEPPQ
jgi:biopolymer transport protein ExbB/TolQ